MSNQCLNPGELHRLIQDRTDDSEQIQHLDNCTGCQRALEALAGGGYAVPIPGEWTVPPTDSAFWPALQQVCDDLEDDVRPTMTSITLRPFGLL
jgi:hypothetical protein